MNREGVQWGYSTDCGACVVGVAYLAWVGRLEDGGRWAYCACVAFVAGLEKFVSVAIYTPQDHRNFAVQKVPPSFLFS